MSDPEEDDRESASRWPVDIPWTAGDTHGDDTQADIGGAFEDLVSGVRSGTKEVGAALSDVEIPALTEENVISSNPVENVSVPAADADAVVEAGGEAVALSVETGGDVATVLVDTGDEAIEVTVESGGEEAAEAVAEVLAASLEGA